MPSSMRFFLICFAFLNLDWQSKGQGLIQTEVDKEKLRIAEDLISERNAEIKDLRSTVATLETQVKDFAEQVSFPF